MKKIVFYLPQFHEIPENNKWWGDGFTEWVNVRKAYPLYEGHEQPKVPLNKNFYNLLDKNTLKWQVKLAKENGIDGFCFYHYYFNGKKLLEKPAELLLKEKEIKVNFCFSWANEPWTRAWDGKTRDIIMPQEYGREKEWLEHIDYLLPFFKDERYIKKENKPIFLIYRTNNIPNCDKMIEFWDERLRKEGFDGVYIIETLNSFQKEPVLKKSQGIVEFEPMLTMRHYLSPLRQLVRIINKKLGKLDIVSYEEVWDCIIRRKRTYEGKKRSLGAFVSWDNTARKGAKGLIIEGATPEKFGKYIEIQNSKENIEFLFINAWNEWAEGTYLEPDERNNYQYLEKIKKLK